MPRFRFTFLRVCFLCAIAWPGARAQPTSGTVLPVRELTIFEFQALSNLNSLNGVVLTTAAHAGVATLNGSASNVERQPSGMSAVYSAAAIPSQSTAGSAAENGAPESSELFNFKQSGDSAQSWATMRANGSPFLLTHAYGKASATANVSWTAKISLGPLSILYAAIRIPAVTVNGTFEEDGPSRWKARMRADLMINGTVAWSTESNRFNVPSGNTGSGSNCSERTQKGTFLNTFEKSLGIDPDNVNDASATQTVYLRLGPYSGSASPVEVTFVVRADAQSLDKCCLQNGEYFCTRAGAKVDWDSPRTIIAPVRFWTGTMLLHVPSFDLEND